MDSSEIPCAPKLMNTQVGIPADLTEKLAIKINKKALLSQGNRAMPQLFFSVQKFADNIHYKFKSSQASKARLQSSKHTGTKQN